MHTTFMDDFGNLRAQSIQTIYFLRGYYLTYASAF